MIPARKAHVPTKKKAAIAAGEASYNTEMMSVRRHKLGLSHEDITAQTGAYKRLSRPTVAAVLNGDPKSKIGHVLIVLKILGLTLADVVMQQPTKKTKVA